jgi:hypothetical protein
MVRFTITCKKRGMMPLESFGNSYSRTFVIHWPTARPCFGRPRVTREKSHTSGSIAAEARTVEAHSEPNDSFGAQHEVVHG